MPVAARQRASWQIFSLALFSLLLTILIPVTSTRAMTGLVPLDTPAFQNGWLADSPAWASILRAYTGGQLAVTAERLQALLDGPEALLAAKNLAVVYKDAGKMAEAAAAYRQAIALSPADAGLWRDLGWALYDAARREEAAEAFVRALELAAADPWSLYGLGLSRAASNPQAALYALEQAVAADPLLAAAQYDLGLLYLQSGRAEEATKALQAALSADGNYTGAHAYLARLYEAKGQLAAAWNAYQKGALARPQDAALLQDKVRFQNQHADFIKEAEQAASKERAAVQPIRVTPIQVAGAPPIRVGLLEGASTMRLAWGAPLRLRRNNQQVTLLPAGDIWTLTNNGNVLTLTSPGREMTISGAAPWTLQSTDGASTITVYDMEVGKGSFYAYVEHRHYRGDIEVSVRNGGMTLVNTVDLESYLASVVPSEMYASMPGEALKVQAVAARTYTLKSLGRYAARGFDVLGTPASSEYRGAQAEQASTTAAVLATAGQVLVAAGGTLAETYYSATAGGYSVSSEEAWGGARPYLIARLDSGPVAGAPVFPLGPAALEAWIKQAPAVFASQSRFTPRANFRWVKIVEADELTTRANARKNIGAVAAVIPGKRSEGGYVQEVTIRGAAGELVVKGDIIRSTLGGLRSNLFKVEAQYGADGKPLRFVFCGGGYGHGVGMDQLGASGMAEMGYTMSEIIQHYFGSLQVVKRY